MLRRMTPSSAQLTGGDLSVDILHTEDSVSLGDGTNLLGSFALVEGKRALPAQVLGVGKFKLTDSTETDFAEIDDVGGEKALKVSVIASVGGGGGGTAATDEASFSSGATQGTPLMGYYDADGSEDLTDGQMGVARMTAERALHVEFQNTSLAVTGTFWQATQPVSGTVSVTGVATSANQSTIIGHLDGVEGLLGTIDTDTGNIDSKLGVIDDWDATHGSAHPTDGVMAMGSNGTNAYRLRVTDSNGRLSVDVNSMPTTTVTGTVAVTGTFWQATQPVSIAAAVAVTDNSGSLTVDDGGSSLTVDGTVAATQSGTWNVNTVSTLTSITNAVTTAGAAAHDAGISGNPVPVAARAKNSNPTAVADGDSTYIMSDLAGRQIVSFSDRALVTQATGSQSNTTEATMLAAGGANVFLDLTQLILTNSNSTTAAQVQIRDASTGTIRFEHMIPPSSGMVVNFPVPFKQTTANNAWTIDLNASVSTVYWTVQAIQRLA